MRDEYGLAAPPRPAASDRIPYVEQVVREMISAYDPEGELGKPLGRLPDLPDLVDFLFSLKGPRDQFAALVDRFEKRELWRLFEMAVNLAIAELRFEARIARCQGSA